jgi:hypothetical protein
MIRIAILDDYQNVSLEMADWSPLAGRAVITVFNDHLADSEEIVERLLPFDVVCVMRERTPLPRSVIEPLSTDHPFRSLDNVLATPHIGYVTRELYRTFYGDTVKNITRWLDQQA